MTCPHHRAGSSCLLPLEVGAVGGIVSQLLPWWPDGLCPLEQKGRVGRGAPLRERRPTGWDRNVKEDWVGPRGKDRKALTPRTVQCLSS